MSHSNLPKNVVNGAMTRKTAGKSADRGTIHHGGSIDTTVENTKCSPSSIAKVIWGDFKVC